jgi:glycerol kinase
MKYILALDQGTTSSRAIIFNSQGEITAMAQKEFRQIFPQSGWVEHDPMEIWGSQIIVAQQALAQAKLSGTDIAAIGITNQRETTIVWDRKSGKPIYNAIVWQDRRTAGLCEQFRAAGVESLITQKTGLLLDPYFSGTKVRWILDNVPGAKDKAKRGELAFGTVDTWLIWNLTKGRNHVTDASNASRTLFYNLHSGDWDSEILEVMKVPATLLPSIVDSSGVCGETEKDFFGTPISIAGIAGDQQSALFGQVCHQPGMAKNTYGTGCFMLMNTGEKSVASKSRLLTTAAWRVDRKNIFALEGSVFIAGAVVQWLRDGVKMIQSSAEVESLATSVTDADGVYFVPAFTGLGSPYWDPYARGMMIGLTRGTTTAHIARAALESIAYQTADVLKAMQSDSGVRLNQLRVDGGAAANNLLMQFQADILGVPVMRPHILETTALGAAYLAGIGVGYWKISEIQKHWQVEKIFEPRMSMDQAQVLYAQWKKAVQRSMQWAND